MGAPPGKDHAMEKSEKGKGCRSWKYQKCDGITWPGKSRDGIINPYFLFYDTYLGYKVVAGISASVGHVHDASLGLKRL